MDRTHTLRSSEPVADARSRKLSAGGGVDERSQPDSAEFIDRRALLRNVRDAAGFGQVDIPLGIRHDHVRLHHGTGAYAVRHRSRSPGCRRSSCRLPKSCRRSSAFWASASITPLPVLPLISFRLNLRACHDAGDVEAILAISRDGISRGRRSDQVVPSSQ